MALFSNLQLTNAGQQAVNAYILGSTKTPISLTAIAIGDGAKPANPAAQTSLVREVKRLAVESSALEKGVLTVTARLSTDTITQDITHREIGLYSGTTLFAYANAGDDYDYIPAAGQNTAVVKLITVRITVGTIDVKLETLPADDYVTYAGLEQRVKREVADTVPNEVQTNFNRELPNAVKQEIKAQIPDATAEELKKQLPDATTKELTKQLPDAVENEVHTLIDNGRINEIVNEEVVDELNSATVTPFSTPEGTATQQAKFVQLSAEHTTLGRLDYITLDTRQNATTEVNSYLLVWEMDEKGGWAYCGTSHNNPRLQNGQPVHYDFRGVEIHGRALRLALVPTQEGGWNPDTFVPYTIGCTPATTGDMTTGDTITPPTGNAVRKIAALTLGICAPRYTPYVHYLDGDSHLQDGERDGWNAKLDDEDLIAADALDLAAHCTTLDERQFNACYIGSQYAPSGRLLAIELPCRTEGVFTGSTIPVYLQLLRFTEGETKLEFVASSDNTATPGPGVLCRWEFAQQNVQLDGGAIALYLGTVPKFTQVQLKFDALVCAAIDERSGILTNNATARVSHTIPALKFLVSRPIFASPQEFRQHALNADAHVSKPDRTKWDKAAADINAHDADAVRHVDTPTRAKWDAKPDADAVQETVANALLEDVEVTDSTGNGGTDADARYLQIAAKFVPTGKVTGISIKCRASTSDKIATTPTFLAVWEKNESDENYTRLVSSTAAVQQVIGETHEWTFDELELHGRTIRLVFLSAADSPWPGTDQSWQHIGVSVGAREEGDTESSYIGPAGGTNNYLASLSIRHIVRMDKFAHRLTDAQTASLAWLIEHQADIQNLIPQA